MSQGDTPISVSYLDDNSDVTSWNAKTTVLGNLRRKCYLHIKTAMILIKIVDSINMPNFISTANL